MRGGRLLALAGLALAAACGRGGEEAGPAAPASAAAAEQRAEAERIGAQVSFENALGMRFALVPAAPESTLLGSPPGEATHPDEIPEHEVKLFVPYYVQRAETTNAQWARWPKAPRLSGAPSDPATGMTHEEASEFARFASETDPDWDYRLPTEAEWEHAARAGGDGRAPTARGGENAWGLLGVHEGPWEWCADWWGPYPSWFTTNPTGPESGGEHVLRGGTWREGDPPARATAREHRPPGERHPRIGLRLVALVGYFGKGRGSAPVTIRTVDLDLPEGKQEVGGYRVRIVSVFTRLSSRQAGQRISWTPLPGESSPVRALLVPGRYYAQAERTVAGGVERGAEMKIQANPGEAAEFLVPIPKPDAMLLEPQ
jgi:formylglycine-generating enzyme required for sulfatase activity